MRPGVLRPPVRRLPLTSEFSGSARVISSLTSHVWKRRAGEVGFCFLIATDPCLFRRRCAFEQLDARTRGEHDPGLLPAAGLARRIATALGLWLLPHRPHIDHVHVEDLLDGAA